MSGVLVRPAGPDDAAVVAVLFNAINSLDGPGPAVPMTAAGVMRDLLGPNPWALLLVAESGGVVIGFATGSRLHDSGRAQGAFMLVDLYVVPDARRRGAGRALVAAMARLARQHGAGCLWCGVDDGDDEAFAFYRAIGAAVEEHFRGMILVDRAFDDLSGKGA